MASSFSPRIEFARRIAHLDAPLRLYGILDAESCARRGLAILDVAHAWRDAGIRLIQYRDKQGSDSEVVANAVAIAKVFAGTESTLLLNDRVSLVAEAGWHGAHIGQDDGSVEAARAALGPDAVVGLSTHSLPQVEAAGTADVDYIALGPIFATTTKENASPVVGLCTLQAASALTTKPIVAIGGITQPRARQVITAGAASVAVISTLLPADVRLANDRAAERGELEQSARDFLLSVK